MMTYLLSHKSQVFATWFECKREIRLGPCKGALGAIWSKQFAYATDHHCVRACWLMVATIAYFLKCVTGVILANCSVVV